MLLISFLGTPDRKNNKINLQEIVGFWKALFFFFAFGNMEADTELLSSIKKKIP